MQPDGYIDLDRDSLLDQTGGYPVFGLGDGAAFSDFDDVTQLELALFVVGVVLAGLTNDFPVQLVFDTTLNQYGDSLFTLIADNLASQSTFEGSFSFRHL
jgi:hypothetical protein